MGQEGAAWTAGVPRPQELCGGQGYSVRSCSGANIWLSSLHSVRTYLKVCVLLLFTLPAHGTALPSVGCTGAHGSCGTHSRKVHSTPSFLTTS